jgi:hypothetical protein
MMGESRVTLEVGFAHDVEQGMKNLQEPGGRSSSIVAGTAAISKRSPALPLSHLNLCTTASISTPFPR